MVVLKVSYAIFMMDLSVYLIIRKDNLILVLNLIIRKLYLILPLNLGMTQIYLQQVLMMVV